MYLDSANIEEIIETNKLGIIKGVTTNPTILMKERKSKPTIIKEVLQNTDGDVFVQISGNTLKEMYQNVDDILSISTERIVLKIPINSVGIELISCLKNEISQIPILGTAIFSVEQGILAGFAGCEYIAPYVNRMEKNNINPFDIIKNTRKIYEEQTVSTQILGASFKNTNQVKDSLYAGAHTVTVSFKILKHMINQTLAKESIEVFNEHDRIVQELVER